MSAKKFSTIVFVVVLFAWASITISGVQAQSNDELSYELPNLDEAFYLFNRKKKKWIDPIEQGETISLEQFEDLESLDIAFKKDVRVGSIAFQLDDWPAKTENIYDYRATWQRQNRREIFRAGRHLLRAKVYSEKSLKGTLLKEYSLSFFIKEEDAPVDPPPPVSGDTFDLHFYDDRPNEFLAKLGKKHDLAEFKEVSQLNVALKGAQSIGSVEFQFNTERPRKENLAEFTLFKGNEDHKSKLSVGDHRVVVRVFSGKNLSGNLIKEFTSEFEITDDSVTDPPSGGNDPIFVLPEDRSKIPKDPVFKKTKNVNQTIVIDRPGVYDFENVLHIFSIMKDG